MKLGETVFVDTGAWIALAVSADPFHARAVEQWEILQRASARLATSALVLLETFTFLDRNSSRDSALLWRRSLAATRRLEIFEGSRKDLDAAIELLQSKGHSGVSLVDAASFVLMRAHRIRRAFSFDYHFAAAGFLPVA